MSDGIFPKDLCMYLMYPSGEEPTDTSGRKKGNLGGWVEEISVSDTRVQCCYSISALGRRQLRIITLFLAAACRGVYMHTWQAGLKWKRVVHRGKLLLPLSLSLPLFNLKMWYSSDKTLQQEWVSILESNSCHSCVGIDFPFACSSSSMQVLLPGAPTRWITEISVMHDNWCVRFIIDADFYALFFSSVTEKKWLYFFWHQFLFQLFSDCSCHTLSVVPTETRCFFFVSAESNETRSQAKRYSLIRSKLVWI